jgi:hypothetical protein
MHVMCKLRLLCRSSCGVLPRRRHQRCSGAAGRRRRALSGRRNKQPQKKEAASGDKKCLVDVAAVNGVEGPAEDSKFCGRQRGGRRRAGGRSGRDNGGGSMPDRVGPLQQAREMLARDDFLLWNRNRKNGHHAFERELWVASTGQTVGLERNAARFFDVDDNNSQKEKDFSVRKGKESCKDLLWIQ